MTFDQTLTRLEVWQKRQKELTKQYEKLRAMTGAMPDCELLRPIFDIWMGYTVAVSELIGDKDEWLQWYEFECDMGRKPMAVTMPNGVSIKVKNIKQLARVIVSDPLRN